MQNEIIHGIGFDTCPMPIYFYYGCKRYLYGLIKRKRFGTDIRMAKEMPCGKITSMVSRFGKDAILVSLMDSYVEMNTFYVIVREGLLGRVEYYKGFSSHKKRGKQKAMFTGHATKAYISASRTDIEQSLQTVRSINPKEKLAIEPIILNVRNVIQQPNFNIFMFDGEKGCYCYLSKYDNGYEIKSCKESLNALNMSYDEALRKYNELTSRNNNQRYKFAVIRRPQSNIKADDLEHYHAIHHETGRVQVGFYLKNYRNG